MEASIQNQTVYSPSESFFISKGKMEGTSLFNILQHMPKGAVLHIHDLSAVSLDWLVSNVTYRSHLFFCVDSDKFMIFHFFIKPPNDTACKWTLVQNARAASPNVKSFDLSLKKNMSLLATDPLTAYADDSQVWKRFNKYFQQVKGMIQYLPVFKDYFRQMLVEFRLDNVQYLELRAQLVGIYDLSGNTYDEEFGLQICRNVTQQFVTEFPDFSGAKIIMAGLRFNPVSSILTEVKTAMSLHSKYPDFMVGFDLVGEEPNEHSLLYYINDLLYPSRQSPAYHLPYFFHAAETTWQGSAVDYNLVDAILLNTSRIGHGYALDKHPELSQIVKKRGICIEVNPISNQLLGLVDDLRNHPMVPLMADNYPIVISSDDPATWEALPLSHDFYLAFMDMCGEDCGLTFLKQLAINSIKYSAMTTEEKEKAMTSWESKWNSFIEGTARKYL